jgi:hypothetical protein
MKEQKFLSKFFAIAVFLAALSFQTFAQQPERPNPTGDGTEPAAAAGLVSGLFSLAPGQSVRVAAVNMGKKAIPVEFVFVSVNEQGKVQNPIRCNATPAAGDAMIEKFSHTGGANRMLMYVQIRVREAKDLKDIAQSLEVFNEQPDLPGGGPHIFLSAAYFAEFCPIWAPA